MVDYVLNCERPHSFLIMSAHSGFVIGDTKKIEREDQLANSPSEKHASTEQQPFRTEPMESRHWQGKLVRVAVGRTTENGQQMSVPFAVLNASGQTIEVLPPQIQLAGTSKDKYRKAIKAEPVAVRDYRITTRRLGPGERADGVVVFDRPSFKESSERLLLEVAQAEAVDRPVLAPIAFVAPMKIPASLENPSKGERSLKHRAGPRGGW